MPAASAGLDGAPTEWAPSAREQDVIRLLLADCTNAEIAYRLRISCKTVEFHLTNMYRRYNLGGRVGLAVMAIQRRWT